MSDTAVRPGGEGRGMRKPGVDRCSCGGEVTILPSYGGLGTNSATMYLARCNACGKDEDDLGNGDGTMRSAIRQWNRFRKADAAARGER